MTEFPVPLDNLITYVKALNPGAGPLDNVTDAFSVSVQLGEEADALIGYFVDQARRSGLSWSQIGSAMGVSKQAAQKRFVPPSTKVADLMAGVSQPFSRFAPRAAATLAAAGKLASPNPVGCAHLAAALPSEPDGVAARVIAGAGVSAEQIYAAAGAGPASRVPAASTAELLELHLDERAKDALKGALKSALRLEHNYIGTEHLLLGLVSVDGPVTSAFAGLGLTAARAEELVRAEIAAVAARKALG